MEHLFVPYKIALKAKQLGFNSSCFGWFNYPNEIEFNYPPYKNESLPPDNDVCVAPLYQQVIDWLISDYNMLVSIACYTLDRGKTIFYQWEIRQQGEQFHIDNQSFNSYYEALNNGVERALEYVEEKNGIHKDT